MTLGPMDFMGPMSIKAHSGLFLPNVKRVIFFTEIQILKQKI